MDDQVKLIWADELSIENPAIDKEHKKLIEIYNDLVDFVRRKGNRKEFAEILSKMTDYSLEHFRKEEKYMEKFGYPKLSEHQRFHRNYIYLVTMYNNQLSEHNPPDPKEIINFLGRWWLNHIRRSDKEYESYKKENHLDAQY